MSAFVEDGEHIRYLLDAAMSSELGITSDNAFRWGWNVKRKPSSFQWMELRPGDYEQAARVGQMLWEENIISVLFRYPDCTRKNLPGPIDCDFKYGKHVPNPRARFTPGRVLKACDGYAYESCEHPKWEASEAFAFIDALRSRAWRALPDYQDAPWEITSEEER